MYQVVKDNITFYVEDINKAVEYAKEGCDVYVRTKLVLDDVDLSENENVVTLTGVGTSKKE